MSTMPTDLPIPSEDSRDLKFNSGKLDEVASSPSHFYTDRFGVKRYTIAGINYTASEAISAFGYITIDSFQDGATLTLPDTVADYLCMDSRMGSTMRPVIVIETVPF